MNDFQRSLAIQSLTFILSLLGGERREEHPRELILILRHLQMMLFAAT